MDIIISHAHCPDGFCAAFIAKKKYPEAEVIFLDHGADHTEILKKADGKDILMIDFSLRTYEEMRRLGYSAKSLTLFDHHRSAQQTLSKAVEELSTVREMTLSSGEKVYFDAEDEEKLKEFSWSKSKHGGSVAYTGGGRANSKYVYMHRFIMNASADVLVDHINRNTLDNRKCNLRFATKKQNAANMDRGSGRKGITPRGDRWIAQIAVDYKNIYLGIFETIDDAARAYDKAAEEHFGEFARRNFADSLEPFPANAKIVFDMSRSGAGLAWDYLFGKDSGYVVMHRERSEREWGDVGGYLPRPWWVEYTEVRDLWQWERYPDSREVCAYLGTLPFEFDAWSALDVIDPDTAANLGVGALAHINHYVREAVKQARRGKLAGYDISVLNVPYLNCSEVGNELAKTSDFSLTWFERGDGQIQFSLRSIGDKDVSAIAKRFNGGGHKNAAGFQLSLYEGRKLIDDILHRHNEAYPPPTAVGPRHG